MDGEISVVSYWENPSPLLPAVAAFYWVKSRAAVTPSGFQRGLCHGTDAISAAGAVVKLADLFSIYTPFTS